MGTNILDFIDVSYSYSGGSVALTGVNLTVQAGEFVAIMGANGSGKSTLAKLANALLVPSSGEVVACGFSTSAPENAFAVRQRVGFLFQNPDDQLVMSLLRDDVAFGPRNLGLPPAEVAERVAEALAAVGLDGRDDADVNMLSGGQKQLAALAGVLAMRPEVVLLDEPGAMLDVRGRTRVLQAVKRLREQGTTIVMITHFAEHASHADRVVVLGAGHVQLDGTPEEVFAQTERLRGLGIEPPFEQQLQALRKGQQGSAAAQRTGEDGSLVCHPEQCSPEGRGASSKDPAQNASRSDAYASPALSFHDVSFRYEHADCDAVSGVSFELAPGDFLGVIGSTGSGKSTFAQLCNGLLAPMAGRVTACGINTADSKQRLQVHRRVGLAFQYPERQLFAATVAEDVMFGPRNLGFSEGEAREAAARALARVGLSFDELAESSPFALSGGQQRRVALAGVLAMDPQVFVLDEPVAGMDPVAASQLRGLLASLNASGMTIVLISHSMEDVAALCNKVLCLSGGQTRFFGTPAQVFAPEHEDALQACGLDLPWPVKRGMELVGKPTLTLKELAVALL